MNSVFEGILLDLRSGDFKSAIEQLASVANISISEARKDCRAAYKTLNRGKNATQQKDGKRVRKTSKNS